MYKRLPYPWNSSDYCSLPSPFAERNFYLKLRSGFSIMGTDLSVFLLGVVPTRKENR